MNEKFDEYGNRTEFTPNESEGNEMDAVDALQETIERFEFEEEHQFNRARFEEKAASRGQSLGKGARTALEFAGDSLGLIILKNGGNRDLAYKLIKSGRKVGETLESVVNVSVKEGGRLLGNAAEQVDIDYLKERAGEVKNDVKRTVKESDVMEKIEPEYIKARAKDMVHTVTEKVQEGKEKFFKPEDPEEARRKQEELEAKIEAFEKLYEDEEREIELHQNKGYTPEEFKETK